MKTFLNIGCGSRFHPDWTNADLVPRAECVDRVNFLDEFPYPDGSFSAVYCSHILEHFRCQDVPKFLQRCHRVLKPGGVVRIAVPDLEQIAKLYLEYLRLASMGDEAALRKHEWMLFEMYDQVVREQSGGRMLAYLDSFAPAGDDFIRTRIGEEAERIWASASKRTENRRHPATPHDRGLTSRIIKRVKDVVSRRLFGCDSDYVRNAVKNERFRNGGEVHRWMYDQVSLKRLLDEAGFKECTVTDAVTSRISNFATFELDSGPDGSARKPDSIYVEAVK